MAREVSVVRALKGSAPVYNCKYCRRYWAEIIEKVYLRLPFSIRLFCPRCKKVEREEKA